MMRLFFLFFVVLEMTADWHLGFMSLKSIHPSSEADFHFRGSQSNICQSISIYCLVDTCLQHL